MARIAIVGPGAIGGTLAALLHLSGDHEVILCARTPFRKLVVRRSVQKTLECELPVCTEPGEVRSVDWVILATKTYQVAAASKWFESLCDDTTKIAVTQNGVEHVSNLAPFFDVNRVIPVVIDCPAEHTGPGQIFQHGDAFMTVPSDKNGARFAALFDDPGVEVKLTEDWVSAAWMKLCTNCAGAVSAIANRPVNVAREPRAAATMTALIHECIAVGRAEGAVIDDLVVEVVMASQRGAADGAMNSIHADRVAGRPMEWSARNGVIVRLGEKHGIPTPGNRMIADLLSLIEAGHH